MWFTLTVNLTIRHLLEDIFSNQVELFFIKQSTDRSYTNYPIYKKYSRICCCAEWRIFSHFELSTRNTWIS